jgi:hypothetical protein
VGWDALPELIAAKRLREAGATDVDVRFFCTFTAAMERARDSLRLWDHAANLYLKKRWAFEPEEIAKKSSDDIKDAIQSAGVSQRHDLDARAWLAIGKSLSQKNCAPDVYRAIYDGTGDVATLLNALASTAEGPLFHSSRVQKSV